MNRRITDRPQERGTRWIIIGIWVCSLVAVGMLAKACYHGVQAIRTVTTTIEAREAREAPWECSPEGYRREDFWTADVWKQEHC